MFARAAWVVVPPFCHPSSEKLERPVNLGESYTIVSRSRTGAATSRCLPAGSCFSLGSLFRPRRRAGR